MRILVVEDERRLAQIIKRGLVEGGYAVDLAFDGEEGKFLAESEDYDLIILDLMLPKIDGLEICRKLRSDGIKTPILILTAKTTLDDKVAGLNSGADDYLTKPFAFLELSARVAALIRRSQKAPATQLTVADLVLDPTKHLVKRGGRQIKLTPKEFSILELLLSRKDEVVSRTVITEHVWDYNFDGMSNVVDVFVASLRKKIVDAGKNKIIQTVHGVGYRIAAENEA
ncbi:MAG: response regulator transcription factor [Patescibacteria group bacterium]